MFNFEVVKGKFIYEKIDDLINNQFRVDFGVIYVKLFYFNLFIFLLFVVGFNFVKVVILFKDFEVQDIKLNKVYFVFCINFCVFDIVVVVNVFREVVKDGVIFKVVEGVKFYIVVVFMLE